jgi:hypothetical protein
VRTQLVDDLLVDLLQDVRFLRPYFVMKWLFRDELLSANKATTTRLVVCLTRYKATYLSPTLTHSHHLPSQEHEDLVPNSSVTRRLPREIDSGHLASNSLCIYPHNS